MALRAGRKPEETRDHFERLPRGISRVFHAIRIERGLKPHEMYRALAGAPGVDPRYRAVLERQDKNGIKKPTPPKGLTGRELAEWKREQEDTWRAKLIYKFENGREKVPYGAVHLYAKVLGVSSASLFAAARFYVSLRDAANTEGVEADRLLDDGQKRAAGLIRMSARFTELAKGFGALGLREGLRGDKEPRDLGKIARRGAVIMDLIRAYGNAVPVDLKKLLALSLEKERQEAAEPGRKRKPRRKAAARAALSG